MATITLTDGTTTLNLLDGTNYLLKDESWEPNVAAFRPFPVVGDEYTKKADQLRRTGNR